MRLRNDRTVKCGAGKVGGCPIDLFGGDQYVYASVQYSWSWKMELGR